MNATSRALLFCGLLPFIAYSTVAQLTARSQVGDSEPSGGCTQTGRIIVTTGAPYSAIEETETSQTLADGTHIEKKWQSALIYRDSQGRTRRDLYGPRGAVGAQENVLINIMITDVVDCVQYNLSPETHTAFRMTYPMSATQQVTQSSAKTTTPPTQARPVQAPEGLRPKTSHESLGTQTIEGVLADGSRTATTFPAGSIGNDRQIVTVNEAWYAADLRLVVLRSVDDPRSEKRTTRLFNIDRTEPDPALFRVPPDYTITTTVTTKEQP